MANWKEDMISRIKQERLEKEIKDMEVDFTKHRKEINQEFDNLCKEIEELDYDSSIHMNRIVGNGNCLRKLTVLGVEYSLLIEKNQISIIAKKNEGCTSYQIYRVVGDVGQDKIAQYTREEDIKLINEWSKMKNKLDTKDFDYKKILDTLMDNAYTEIYNKIEDLEIKSMQEKARQTIADKGLENLLNSTDFRNQ